MGDACAQERDRAPTRVECSLVGGRVDAGSEPCYDRQALGHQEACGVGRESQPPLGGRSGADDGYAFLGLSQGAFVEQEGGSLPDAQQS